VVVARVSGLPALPSRRTAGADFDTAAIASAPGSAAVPFLLIYE
jgi:hypothetical protein